eukprot:Transcript_8813.p1 GENE.Transcript_8813~~Transcript_8813.p1  ORF type:complete len:332 (-),score=67.37 Transcript_8813:203-1198(-)
MASTSTMATGALSVPAIRMQLDRKDQPHAFYKVQVETAAGTVQAGWKRWSECRQFAYAMMLQAIDAPKFPSHKFISVCSSDAFRLVSNRCLDPDYLERRRNSLETYFRLCYAKSPAAVMRFLSTGAEADRGVHQTPLASSRRSIDGTWTSSGERAESSAPVPTPTPAPMPAPVPAPVPEGDPAAADDSTRRALRYDAPPAERAGRGSRGGRRGVRFTKGGRGGGSGSCPGLCLLWAALVGLVVALALGSSGAAPWATAGAPAGDASEAGASASDGRLVCTGPPANSSDGMNGCGPRPSPWRWLSLEATPATLGLYAVLALATLAPREWVPY